MDNWLAKQLKMVREGNAIVAKKPKAPTVIYRLRIAARGLCMASVLILISKSFLEFDPEISIAAAGGLIAVIVGWGVTRYFDERIRQKDWFEKWVEVAIELIETVVEFHDPLVRLQKFAIIRCAPELSMEKIDYNAPPSEMWKAVLVVYAPIIERYVRSEEATWRPDMEYRLWMTVGKASGALEEDSKLKWAITRQQKQLVSSVKDPDKK